MEPTPESLTALVEALLKLAIHAPRLLLPWQLPPLFGLFGPGLWVEGAPDNGACFRFELDLPQRNRVSAAEAVSDGGPPSPSATPIALIPAPEPEVRPETVCALCTPMDLPSELDFYAVLHGPRSSPGPLHRRIRCAFCSGSGRLDGWTVPPMLTCPITLELMVDPVTLGGTGIVCERAAITAWLEEHPPTIITSSVTRLRDDVQKIRDHINGDVLGNILGTGADPEAQSSSAVGGAHGMQAQTKWPPSPEDIATKQRRNLVAHPKLKEACELYRRLQAAFHRQSKGDDDASAAVDSAEVAFDVVPDQPCTAQGSSAAGATSDGNVRAEAELTRRLLARCRWESAATRQCRAAALVPVH